MARKHREFRFGHLSVQGDRFTFRPEADRGTFEARRGDDADLVLNYHYEERGNQKETVDVRLTVELEGESLGTRAAHLVDHPFIKDEGWGRLKQAARLRNIGTLRGRYKIDANCAMGPWFGRGSVTNTPFHHEGTFAVRVQ